MTTSSDASPGESTILAIITARGGSKGIPDKNVRAVGGKPLIAWTIERAEASRWVDRIIASTDDDGIAAVACKHGAEVPFLRPAELAQDDSPTLPVLLHALAWLADEEDYRPDYVLLLQPTSPLRSTEDIDGAIELALEKGADGVVSVCEPLTHPKLLRGVCEDGRLVEPVDKAIERRARQELPPAYALNGAIYLSRTEILIREKTFYTEKTYAYVMPQARSLDIDDAWQLELADLILGGGVTA